MKPRARCSLLDLGRSLVGLWGVVGLMACAPKDPAERGAGLFEKHCAPCHADDGTGNPMQRHLYPTLDLTRSEMVQRRANGVIYRRIAYGWGTMPGFNHRLEYEDLVALVEYTMHFAEGEKQNGSEE